VDTPRISEVGKVIPLSKSSDLSQIGVWWQCKPTCLVYLDSENLRFWPFWCALYHTPNVLVYTMVCTKWPWCASSFTPNILVCTPTVPLFAVHEVLINYWCALKLPLNLFCFVIIQSFERKKFTEFFASHWELDLLWWSCLGRRTTGPHVQLFTRILDLHYFLREFWNPLWCLLITREYALSPW
jgi:hypothetical protein